MDLYHTNWFWNVLLHTQTADWSRQRHRKHVGTHKFVKTLHFCTDDINHQFKNIFTNQYLWHQWIHNFLQAIKVSYITAVLHQFDGLESWNLWRRLHMKTGSTIDLVHFSYRTNTFANMQCLGLCNTFTEIISDTTSKTAAMYFNILAHITFKPLFNNYTMHNPITDKQ